VIVTNSLHYHEYLLLLLFLLPRVSFFAVSGISVLGVISVNRVDSHFGTLRGFSTRAYLKVTITILRELRIILTVTVCFVVPRDFFCWLFHL